MIGWLSGRIRELDPAGLLVVDIGGVGYEVYVSLQTLCTMKVGGQAELCIHTHVREDQITLFGFPSPKERAIFRKLTTVSGIGARMAMNLLSGMSADDLLSAIDASDDTGIARTPGIGKKTAQRLILELKGKLVSGDVMPGGTGIRADVRSALINLGYKPAQVDTALQKSDTAEDFEALFKSVLKALA